MSPAPPIRSSTPNIQSCRHRSRPENDSSACCRRRPPEGGAISIHKQVIHEIGLEIYKNRGAFEDTKIGRRLALSAAEEYLATMIQGDVDAMLFLRPAVRSRISIVVSGGS